MDKRLFNLKSQDTKAKELVIIEFLQVTKLCRSGQVRFIPLDGMTTQEIKDGQVLVKGNPLVVDVKEGEYLLAVSRAKIVKKSTGTQIRVHIFPFNAEPAFASVGYYGAIDGKKGLEFWRFPQVDHVFDMYKIMTTGGVKEQ